MIKDFMWSHFERTGDINAYLGFREYSNQPLIEKDPSVDYTKR